MESAAVFRSCNYAVSTSSHLKTVLEKRCLITMKNAAFLNHRKLPVCGGNTSSFKNGRGSLFVSCVKIPETTLTANSNGDPNGAVLSESQQGIQENKVSTSAIFRSGFEVSVELLATSFGQNFCLKGLELNDGRALLTEVCDETKIAELKLKVGAFEIHMTRKIDDPVIPAPVISQATAPSVPSKPANEPTFIAPPPKSSAEKVSPFTNVPVEKAAKLASLEASGLSGYVIILSPSVGSFLRSGTAKGNKRPPACKEGDMITEGQVIGYVDQFSNEIPIRQSNVAGEVMKFLYSDGEAVGYEDPILAVLPSFHGIE
ncbi:hypothetical protein OROMI_007184 [Orobanche minor]